MKVSVRGIVCAVAAATLLATGGCSATRANYDQIMLHYNAGTGENHTFNSCIEPGTSGGTIYDDDTFALPTRQLSWDIRPQGGDSAAPIDSGSKPGTDGQPGPHVATYATAKFYLNVDCGDGKDANSPIVQFWEKIGSKRWAGNKAIVDEGADDINVASWTAMLQNTIVAAEEKALAEGTRFYLADDLDANAHGERAELEKRIAPEFQRELRTQLGGDFFCGVGYNGGKTVSWDETSATVDAYGKASLYTQHKTGTCPPVRISITDVNFADPSIAAARARVYTAEQEAKAKLIAAQAEVDQANKLGAAASNEQYLKYKQLEAQLAAAQACRESSNCTVIVDGTGHAGVLAGR